MKKRQSGSPSGRGRRGIRVRRRAPAPRAPKAAQAKTGQSRGSVNHSRRRSSSNVTINHDEIRQWVESRGGKPATVRSTARKGQAAGLLRIDFPGYSGARSLKPVEWDEWFKTFEAQRLALLYQEVTTDGRQSRFNKLVSRD